MPPAGFVTVRSFYNRIEAELAQSVLEAADLPAFIHSDDCGGVQQALWMRGIELLVRESDLDQARSLLDNYAVYAAPEE